MRRGPAAAGRPNGAGLAGAAGAAGAALRRSSTKAMTCTATDMAPFAADMGHTGPPFPWKEEDRQHARARLDPLFFLLNGLSRDEADYVLSTFPFVREADEAAFNGRDRKRGLILGCMAAFAAGDPESRIAA